MMQGSQQVTFGGSGLDRAAHVRGDPDKLAEARRDPRARVLPFWRNKPLVHGDPIEGAAWVELDHPSLDDAVETMIFLGLDEQGPRFAVDISAWSPPDQQDGPADGFLDTTEQSHPGFPEGHRFVELRKCMTRLNARDAELCATARALMAWHDRHRFCANCGAGTDIAQAGWQRDCPACGAHHFPRTDPVVIMLITRGNSVLVGRSPGWPEGMYSLLAGFVEPGETLEAAVRREVFEEAGVKVGAVSYLLGQPWPFPASLMLACRGEAISDEITIDPAEIEDARWLAREEVADIFAGIHPEIHAPRRGAIAGYVLEQWLADNLPSVRR